MLIDNIKLIVKAGDGGNGAATFRRDAQTSKGGPDGGNGGNGGNIYVQGSNNVGDLREFRYKKKITANNGINGSRQKKSGKKASHITIFLPLGTRITDLDSGHICEIIDTTSEIILAQGGKGGRGNTEFKSATNQTPLYAEKGQLGQEKHLFLELRIIADIGIIGLPNAGKSSLLAVLTNAKPAIADYPFTTLDPNIGIMDTYPIADIPGLIEGASGGKGLGVSFLKHIEKTKILIHCIDLTNNDPLKSYKIVREEFKKFNPLLLQKPEYVLLCKTDLVTKKTVLKVQQLFCNAGNQTLSYSVYDKESISRLKLFLTKLLK